MQSYYPTMWSGCNAYHPVVSWLKVRKIIRSLRAGLDVPPILIDGTLGNGNLLTGTHRCAANDLILLLAARQSIKNPRLVDYQIYDAESASDDLRQAVDESDYETIDEICDRRCL